MATPVSNKRPRDEESSGFFSRLFSSSKKPREVENDFNTTSTPQLPYMELKPVSSPNASIEITKKKRGERTTVNTTTTMTKNNVDPPTVNLRIKDDVKFVIGPSDPLRHRQRRKRYRPQSKTLLARRKRREELPKTCDEEILNRLLLQNKNLFPVPNTDSSTSFTTTGLSRVAKVKRKLGVNQKASRLPMKDMMQRTSYDEKQKKQVSFNPAQTPTHNIRPPIRRKQTPGLGRLKITHSFPTSPLDANSITSSTGSTSSKTSSKGSFHSMSNTPIHIYPKEMKSNLGGNFQFDGAVIIKGISLKSSNAMESAEDDLGTNFGDIPVTLLRRQPKGFERKGVSKKPEEINSTKLMGSDQVSKPKRSKWDMGAFPHMTNTWQCPVCLLRVGNDTMVCPSCETPKPGTSDNSSSVTPSSETKSIVEDGVVSYGNFTFGVAPKNTSGAASSIPIPAKESKFFKNGSTSEVTGTFNFGSAPGNSISVRDEKKELMFVGKGALSKTAIEPASSRGNSSSQGEVQTESPVASSLDKQRKGKDVKPFQPFTFGSGGSSGTPCPQLSQDKPGFLKPLDNKTEIKKSAEIQFRTSETKPAEGNKFNFGASTGNLPTPTLDSAPLAEKGGFQFGKTTSDPKVGAGAVGMATLPFGSTPMADTSGSDVKNIRNKKRRSNNDKESLGSLPTTAPLSSAPNFVFGASSPAPVPAKSTASVDNDAAQSALPGNIHKSPFIFGSKTPSAQDTPSQNIQIDPPSSANPFASKTTPAATPSFKFGSNTNTITPSTSISFGGKQPTSFGPTPAATATNIAMPFGESKTPVASASTFGSSVTGQVSTTPGTGFVSAQTPTAGNSFGSVSVPMGFGTTTNPPFGATQGPAPVSSTFVASSTPAANNAFGGTPASVANNAFGGPSAPTQNGFNFGHTPGQPAFGSSQTPSSGFNAPNGFGVSSFGANPTTPGLPAANTPGGFTIGVGGSKSTGNRKPRRILKAKRPPGSARR